MQLEYRDLVLILPWQIPLPEATSWTLSQMDNLQEGKIYEVRHMLDDNWVQVYAIGSGHHFGCWPIKYLELVSKKQ